MTAQLTEVLTGATAKKQLPRWQLFAYSLTAIPLAMAALPIYVHVPKFYADTLGLNLAAVGGLLLLARVFDAVQDPLLGLWSDHVRNTGKSRLVFVAFGAPMLALGMVGLFSPPTLSLTTMAWWLVLMLLLVYLAFSMMQISYQAYGAEISDDPVQRTSVTALREGLGLAGVFLAALLPEVLSKSFGIREGFGYYSYLLVPLILACVTATFCYSPSTKTHSANAQRGNIFTSLLKPLHNSPYRRLLFIFVFNGIASAIPATLVLFFIQHVIQRADLTAWFLITYFAAGGIGMPLWVRLSARFGKGRAWLVGMLVSVAAFVWAFMLGANDVVPFLIICALSGLGLGADLALPPSILADVIDEEDASARNEGAYFGLWNLVTKLNLALAAGLALPLLSWLGFDPTSDNHLPQTLTALAAIYALLPCALKVIAVMALRYSGFVKSVARHGA